MKTLEQTKRAISVGLITAACVVIVAAATLFCGVTAARADESDNRIDWRWGRPGVMVVTNAPTAVTVTNIAATVATKVAGGVAENLFGPRVTALEGGTNNWNTAYGWGNHAGLYKGIGWFPSWAEVTGKPDLFDWNWNSLTNKPATFPPSAHTHPYTDITDPPWLTEYIETDEIALSHITIIEGGTNNWNTAYGWGNHAGLYRVIGWVPSWGDLTDIPQDFPPSTHEHDYTTITNPPWLTSFTETDEIALSRVTVLEGKTNNWNAAFGWGDHAGLYRVIGWFPSWAEVTDKPATFPPETHQHDHTAITNPPWLTDIPPLDAVLAVGNVAGGSIAITNTAGYDSRTELYDSGLLLKVNGNTVLDVGVGGTGGIWAHPWGGIHLGDHPVVYGISVNGGEPMHGDVELSIIQAESDPVAMAALAGYQSAAYWPPNATASSWFTFTTNSGAITITGYDIMGGGTDVIIPDYINGWPVTTIGVQAFSGSYVTSISGAGNVVTVGDYAFYDCISLASVLLPQARTIGDRAFGYCTLLASASLPQVQTVGAYAFGSCTSLASLYFDNDAPTIGANIFVGITPNQVTNYVTNPQATGWGAKFGDMPVVRLPLHADAITLGGVERADWPEEADLTTPYTQWTAQVPVIDGTATVAIAHGNMPYLVCTNATVMTLDPTGYSTGGVSRVSLSVYTGGQTFTLATNVISYATAPTISTNDWNTILIRRVGNGTWKGVGL